MISHVIILLLFLSCIEYTYPLQFTKTIPSVEKVTPQGDIRSPSASQQANTRHHAKPSLNTRHLAKPSLNTRPNTLNTLSSHRGLPVFNIVEEGAIGDGVTNNKPIFDRLVQNECKPHGCVLFVPGDSVHANFLTSPFNLTSNVQLTIDSGAKISGLQDKRLWPLVPILPSFGRGREFNNHLRHNALISCYHCVHVTINGKGIVDGNGEYWWNMKRKHELTYTRPRLVEFYNCTDVLVQNVTLKNSPFWTLHLVYSRSIVIEGIFIYNPQLISRNADGIDPNSSRDIVIRNNIISTSDDNISIKSGWDEAGIKYGVPSENITIYENYFILGAGMAIGSEMSGGVQGIDIHDNHYIGTVNAVRIKSGEGRGGYIRNVTYRGEHLDGVAVGVFFNLLYAQDANSSIYPVIDDFSIEDMTGVVAKAGEFDCLEKVPCQLKNLKNVSLTAAIGWKCNHVSVKDENNVSPKFCKIDQS